MCRIEFDSFSVLAPMGWEDITATVEVDDPPYTIALGDGVGALQFSIALNTGGRVPDPGPGDLFDLVTSFGQAHSFGSPVDTVLEPGPMGLAGSSYTSERAFIRA